MREYEFRGKSLIDIGNVKKDDWVYGGIVYDDTREWIDIPFYGNILIDPETVGQYTGIKDKNGIKIYEGDIVKTLINGIWYMGQVIYEYSGFTIDVTNNKQLEFGRRGIIERFTEVIGNIYDNKELLGE